MSWFKRNSIYSVPAALLFVLYFSLSLFQYQNFSYTGLDLAIFNQVFWNTTSGNPFAFTFHGSTYLGDHLSVWILLLAPIYALAKHPVTLLAIQSVALSLGIIPFMKIATEIHKEKFSQVTLIAIYCLSALISNVALSEFHMISLFIPLGITTYYFYRNKQYKLFITFFILALLIREDIFLVLSMFSVLAIIDKRPLKWILPPALIGVSYGAFAFSIIQKSSADSYKFLFHYDHLGASIIEIITNLITNPSLIFSGLFSAYTLTFFLYLITPLLFLPLFKPRFLIFLIPPFLQFGLSNVGILSILQTHYVALFTPYILVSTIFGLQKVRQKVFKTKIDRSVFQTALIIASIAAFILFSGIREMLLIYTQPKDIVKTAFFNESVHRGKNYRHISSNVEVLPHLSSRPTIYPWMYVLKGKDQYRTSTIAIPEIEFLALDAFEAVLYEYFFDISAKTRPDFYASRSERQKLIRDTISNNNLGAEIIADDQIILTQSGTFGPIRIRQDIETPQGIQAFGLNIASVKTQTPGTTTLNNIAFLSIPTEITFTAKNAPDLDLLVRFKDATGAIHKEKIIPLTYNLYSSDQWQENETIDVFYNLIVPKSLEKNQFEVTIAIVELEKVEAFNNLNGIDYTLDIKNESEEITIGTTESIQ